MIIGLTGGSTRGHIARAALESTAYQTKDVIDAMVNDAGLEVPTLRVDGGGSANQLMMQFQSDILDIPIERSSVAETTALGAAYLAGLGVGFWDNIDELADHWSSDRSFTPNMNDDKRIALQRQWKKAVTRAQGWASESE